MSTGLEAENVDGYRLQVLAVEALDPEVAAGNVSAQELLRASAIVTPAGKQPPRLEGKPLRKENTRASSREHDDFCDQLR